MFGFSVGFREVGVVVLQHFVLIAVTQLAGEIALFGPAPIIGIDGIVFHCTLAHALIWMTRCGVTHRFSGIFGWVVR